MSFANLTEEDKEFYLECIEEGSMPFDSFVSRKNLQDAIDVQGPRSVIDRFLFRSVKQTAQDRSTRLIPILGGAGTGKTHAYWAYYDKMSKMVDKRKNGTLDELKDPFWRIVYIPSPPSASRVLLHIYTCIMNEIGSEVLEEVTKKLVKRWGGKEKKSGFFSKSNVDEVMSQGIKEYPGIFSDCVKSIVLYRLDDKRSELAERWLLGTTLEEEEMKELKIKQVLESDDLCLAMIKIIMENLEYPVILYFDEIESPYRMHGEEAERKFLETIKRLYNEVNNLVIVLAVLKEIWNRVLETMDEALKSRMEMEQEFSHFTFDDLRMYFAKAMQHFWTENNIKEPVYPLFPLNENVLMRIFKKTNGNQRQIIKLIRMFVDRIVMGDMSLEELEKDEKLHALPQEVAEKQTQTAVKTETSEAEEKEEEEDEESIDKKIEEMLMEEEYTVEVNPSSVVGALLKGIETLGAEKGYEITKTFDLKFIVGKRHYTLAGAVEFNGKKIGIEVPAIQNFERSGGVAAFYAAKRLNDAISQNTIEEGILVVPENTGGKKFNLTVKSGGDKLHKLELTEEEAEFLIQQALKEPCNKAFEAASVVFGDLGEFTGPRLPKDEPEEIEQEENAEEELDAPQQDEEN